VAGVGGTTLGQDGLSSNLLSLLYLVTGSHLVMVLGLTDLYVAEAAGSS